MSVRIEAIQRLQEQAKCKGIRLTFGAGKDARKRLITSEKKFNDAREKVIQHEYATGYRIWIGGGSRYSETSQEATFTKNLTHALVSQLGIDVVTGAGPGIMGAAVTGLQEAKENGAERARNLGIGLKVPWEEDRKSFDYYRDHPELMTRVQELIDLSHAAYVGPGAIGTAFELWTVIQLKQMHHLENDYPLIVHPSWKEGIEAYKKEWYAKRVAKGEKPTMGEDDLNITFSDNVEEIVGLIGQSYKKWQETVGNHVSYRRKRFWRKKQ